MSVLHLVNSTEGLARCLDRLGPNDALILLEAGVYAAMTAIEQPNGTVLDVYVLHEHLSQRGIPTNSVLPAFALIDFEGFVVLTTRHATSVSWP
jgi:sulfur relay protein TusB/DsrH